jgi:protein SCO1/2
MNPIRGRAPRRHALRAAAVAGLAIVLAACGSDGAARSLSGVIRTPPLEVGDVVLPDETPGANGAPFEMRGPRDGLLVVYFGYTSCPDICPTTLSDIGRALRYLEAPARRVDVAMVTVDPERDSGEIIASYLDHFVRRGHALRTTDPVQQEAAQDAFRVIARKIPEGDTYSMEHTAITYVVNDAGSVVLEWPFGTTSRDMSLDLEVLLERDGHPNQKGDNT